MSLKQGNASRSFVHTELLEKRQLLTAAVASVDVLAHFNGTTGLKTLTAYLKANPTAEVNKYIDAASSKQLFNSKATSTLQLRLKPGANVAGAIKLVKAVPNARWSAENKSYGRGEGELTPTDPLFPAQQNQLNLIGAPLAWDTTLGSGITIAVLDDGVDIDHQDLAANIWKNAGEIAGNGIDDDANGYVDDLSGWNFGSGNNNVKPAFTAATNFTDSHGTLVAGVIAAQFNNGVGMAGVAPGAKIMPVRFYGAGVTTTSAGIASSIAYAINNGAKVVNVSFSIDPYMNDPAFAAAVELVKEKGVLWVNSAGNSNVENPPRFVQEQAIFVANTDENDVRYPESNFGVGIDLSAPGTDVWAPAPGDIYYPATGTSFAAAVVSGSAALIWSKNPTWSREQVVAQLTGTADNIDAQNPTLIGKLGAGRVNVGKAVTQSIAAPTVRGLAGLPIDGTIVGTPTLTTLTLKDTLSPATVNGASFRLESAGADNLFGTSDDAVIPLTLTTSYAVGTNQLKFTHATLTSGKYRFVATDAITNPFGAKLDGNGDGIAGGNYVREFAVQSSALNAPTDFTAVPSSSSLTEVQLSWTPVGDKTGFVLQRSTSADFAVIEKSSDLPNFYTRYTDWGLSADKTYYFRIKTVNGADSSPWSAVTYTPPLPTVAPPAPSNLTAERGERDDEIKLTFVINGTNAASTLIERSLTADFASVTRLPADLWGQYWNGGLPAGTTYFYRVKAVNAAGVSAPSNVASFRTAGTAPLVTPPAPTNLVAAPIAISQGARLTWTDNADNESAQVLEWSTSADFAAASTTTLAANATAQTIDGLTSGTYFFRVRATNAAGASAYSNVATLTIVPAPTVPAAPTNLTAAVSSTVGSVVLNWVDAASNETSYVLERSTSPAFDAAATTAVTLAADATTYTATGLAAGTYYFRVRAVNAVGNSADSATVTFTVTAPLVAPTGLGVTVSAGATNSARITWDDVTSTESGFEVESSTTADFAVATKVAAGSNATSATVSNLSGGQTYYVRVRATGTAGNSPYSTTLIFTVPLVAPTGLTATAAAPGVKLTWSHDSVGETGFVLERADNAAFTTGLTGVTVAPTVLTYTDTTAVEGKTYYYRVRATGVNASSANSSAVTFVVPVATPIAASGLTAAAGPAAGSVVLNWIDNASNETKYVLERSTSSAFTSVTSTTLLANSTTTTVTGLKIGTTYYFRVRAYNVVNATSVSNVASTTVVAVPSAPKSLSQSQSGSFRRKISWNDTSNNETKFVYEISTSPTFATAARGEVAANVKTFTFASAASTTYYVRVAAANAGGQSNWATITFTTGFLG